MNREIKATHLVDVFAGEHQVLNDVPGHQINIPIEDYLSRYLLTYDVLDVIVKRRNGNEKGKQRYIKVDAFQLGQPRIMQPKQISNDALEVKTVFLEQRIQELKSKNEKLYQERNEARKALEEKKEKIREMEYNALGTQQSQGLSGIGEIVKEPIVMDTLSGIAKMIFDKKDRDSGQISPSHPYPDLCNALANLNSEAARAIKFCLDVLLSQNPEKVQGLEQALANYSQQINQPST